MLRAVRPALRSCTAHELTLLAVGAAVLGPPLRLPWLRDFQAAVEAQPVGTDLQTQVSSSMGVTRELGVLKSIAHAGWRLVLPCPSQMRLAWAWRRLRERVALDRQEEATSASAPLALPRQRQAGRGLRLAGRRRGGRRVSVVRPRRADVDVVAGGGSAE